MYVLQSRCGLLPTILFALIVFSEILASAGDTDLLDNFDRALLTAAKKNRPLFVYVYMDG